MGFYIPFIHILCTLGVSQHRIHFSSPSYKKTWFDIIVVDRFSKMSYFILCNKIMEESHVVHLFCRWVVYLHGLSKLFVYEKDVRFNSHFWLTLWKKMIIMFKFLEHYHSWADGQIEVVNRNFAYLLWHLVSGNLIAWILLYL